MNPPGAAALAIELITTLDADLLEIIWRSLSVSVSALTLACLLGMPSGAVLATRRFPGHGVVLTLAHALMGLPPVVVGLFVYLQLSRSGPLGTLGLLYTPTAMIIAQFLLILPIIVALSYQHFSVLHEEYDEQLRALGIGRAARLQTLAFDGRHALMSVALAGFGRAIAEVGAVMIVGGNIDHATRVMTTAIALETSKGDLPLALALGIILLLLSLLVSAMVALVRGLDRKVASA